MLRWSTNLIKFLGATSVSVTQLRKVQEMSASSTKLIAFPLYCIPFINSSLRNHSLSMKVRLRVLDCYVYPVLMYGSEAWSITSDMKRRLESCEVWFFRKMMKILWTDKVCNEDVLSRAQMKRKLMKDIRVRQLNFFGHIIRKDGLENLALTGRIEGKRSRGRRSVT